MRKAPCEYGKWDVLPAIKKGSLTQIYGVTEKVDYLMIVERI